MGSGIRDMEMDGTWSPWKSLLEKEDPLAEG